MECGAEGRHSDGGVFRFSKLLQHIQNGTLNFPLPEVPEQGTELLPFVIVGDKAFPLRPFLMRPLSKPHSSVLPPDEEVINIEYL